MQSISVIRVLASLRLLSAKLVHGPLGRALSAN